MAQKKQISRKATDQRADDRAKAVEALSNLLDGKGSALISLKNRLLILEHVLYQRLESTDAEDVDFAVTALVDDIQADHKAVKMILELAYQGVSGERPIVIGGGR